MSSVFFTDRDPSASEVANLVSLLRDVGGLLKPEVIRQVENCVFTEEAMVPVDLETVVILGSRNCGYRVERALELAPFSGRRYVVSGGNLMENGSSEADNMEALLVAGGVLPEMIVKESSARDTRQNLKFVLLSLKDMGARQIGLITGGFHMRRTLSAAAEEFADLPNHTLCPIPAFGPHTTPGSWGGTKKGRLIIADELEKLLRLGLAPHRS